MSEDDTWGDIEVVLHSTRAILDDTLDDVGELTKETAATAERIADTEDRADELLRRLGVTGPERPAPAQGRRSDHLGVAAAFTREAVLERARTNLSDRGIDPDAVALDDLVDEAELRRMHNRFVHAVELSARLDRYDVAAAVIAGLVGGVADALLVKVPRESPITEGLRKLAVPSDNWLADFAKVPYDISWNYELMLTPQYHRVQTPGHDPLLGLVYGTMDILRQTCTGFRPDGTLMIIDNVGGQYPTTWPAALGTQMLHTLSDLFTKSGVPLPGWAALAAIPAGGRHLAQKMYQQGYDSWHCFTMATAPAATELICRAYWGLRSAQDPEFEALVSAAPASDHPRFQALDLVAHGVGAAVDLATFVAAGSNPLLLNYNTWVGLAKRAAAFARTPSSGDFGEQALANQRAIETGWVFQLDSATD